MAAENEKRVSRMACVQDRRGQENVGIYLQ